MKFVFTILLITTLSSISGCKSETKNSYAIKDFSTTLQPYLTRIVSEGIVSYDSSTRYIQKHTTDSELKQLSQSEHPVLRAIAFREMMERPTFDHYNLTMNNLDDTAVVAVDCGEWGIKYYRVSDDMLHNGKWRDSLAKQKTIEEIVLRHNSLSAAYYKLQDLPKKEAYYITIKQMVLRERDWYDDFAQKEDAMYALSLYKRPEDIPILKELVMDNLSRISGTSFGFMGDYPNETYLEIFEKYYPRRFYKGICTNYGSVDLAISFIETLAKYKNEKSAKILDAIFNRKPFIPCSADTGSLRNRLVCAIWNNPCAAYSKLRQQAEGYINKYKEEAEKHKLDDLYLEPDNIIFRKDTSSEPIGW